ncbi:hypothetical protein ACFX15_029703 [Malus domestica]
MHMHCLDPLLKVCADSDGALRIVDRCSRGCVAARNEGQGIADVLYGDSGFTGKLARTMLKRVNQLPMNVGDKDYDPLFP